MATITKPQPKKDTKLETGINIKPKRKSKYALWREKHPNGVLKILDLEAVLQ